jgi:hypothetical protein
MNKGSSGHGAAQWAWWAGRITLRDLEPRANGFVKVLGERLKPSREATAFWRFFPLDVPTFILKSMIRGEDGAADPGIPAGWWFDALWNRQGVAGSLLSAGRRKVSEPVRRVLTLKREGTVSLYEWSDHLKHLSNVGNTDPRIGEWTALEITRQIALLVGAAPVFEARYLRDAKRSSSRLPYVHPANFRIPKKWLEEEEPTWKGWQEIIRAGKKSTQIVYVPKSDRIHDNRYTPLDFASPLFRSVNPVRGLGLILFGLLKRTFDLPAMWNGPGHADVLGMLPKLLLADMTCSSWTLGILSGCLQPRVTENLFLKARILMGYSFEDDTLRDPLAFLSAQDLCRALNICQIVLEKHQLSTMNHRARQLTPISIRQLTEPEWSKDFEPGAEEGGGMHE